MKPLLIVSAVFEAGIGIGLLAVPSAVAQVLFGATHDTPASLTVARVAGAALCVVVNVPTESPHRYQVAPAARQDANGMCSMGSGGSFAPMNRGS